MQIEEKKENDALDKLLILNEGHEEGLENQDGIEELVDSKNEEVDEAALFLHNDMTAGFLNKIGKYEVCTKEEEEELFKRVEKGDQGAVDELILRNQKLVVFVAKRYTKRARTFELMDLIQEGNLGLIEAIKRFDLKRGTRFAAYAIWWIRCVILMALKEKDSAFKISARSFEIYMGAMRQAEADNPLGKGNKDWNALEKYVLDAGVSEETVRGIREYHFNCQPLPIDMDVGGSVLSDFVKDESKAADTEGSALSGALTEQVLNVMRETLSEKEVDILMKRFGFEGEPMTLTMVGRIYGVSRQRIRQIESRAIKKLKLKRYGLLRELMVV